MTCKSCPTSCLTCINSANCTSCASRLYLHQGLCLTNCPTFPVYYFKYDPTFSCRTACPTPYFGFNGTGKCQQSCPPNFFSNITSGSCQACPSGCSSCFGNNCSSCVTGYVYVAKYSSCSKMCSVGLRYYLGDSCSVNCPTGTFLLDDLVTCQKCNLICAQCSQLATNCTVCRGSFWYNYNCVNQCPTSFYVDANNSCQQCINKPSACVLAPLNYTVSSYTKNYTLYFNVTFNRAVNLTRADFAKVAQIKTGSKPLKSSDYVITKTSPNSYSLKLLNTQSLN